MIIPNVPNTAISDKEGNLTTEWLNFMSQLVTELQMNFNNEGVKLPTQTTLNINELDDPNKSIGAMIYDSTTDEFKVNIAGTWRVVTVV